MKQSKKFLKATTAILYATMMLMFGLVSCGQVTGGTSAGSSSGSSGGGSGREATINIKLPQLSASSQSIRSISDDDLPELKLATKSFRVTFRSSEKTVVREVSSDTTNIQATFHVGTEVSVVIECLDASGEVIVRTEPKTIKVQSSNNTIRFILSEDGTKIEPAPDPTPEPEPEPDPEPEQTYTVSYALADGAWDPSSSQPTTEEYSAGDTVTITSNVPTKQDYTFTGWEASPATLIPVGADYFNGGDSFTMPASNVTLTAAWTSSRADVIEINTVDELKEYAEKMQKGTNVRYPNGTTVAANTANYKLMNDLDLAGQGGILLSTSSNRFSGDFDGNGHKLMNLTDGSDALFHDVDSGGIIRNLILENANIGRNYGQQSPFALTMSGKLIGCQVSGQLTGNIGSAYGLAEGSSGAKAVIVGCLSSLDKNSVNGLYGSYAEDHGAAFATDSTGADDLNKKISDWNNSQEVQNDPRLKCDWHFEKSGSNLTLVKGAPSSSDSADDLAPSMP